MLAVLCARDGLRLYPLSGRAEIYLQGGPALIEDCDRQPWLPTLNYAEWSENFPTGGFHIDIPAKTLDFWKADDCPNLYSEAAGIWHGCKVTWHRDSYESQQTLTGGALTFTEPPPATLAERLTTMLMHETKAVDVLEMVQHLTAHTGEQATVNPYALRDDRLPIDERDRRIILARAFTEIAR